MTTCPDSTEVLSSLTTTGSRELWLMERARGVGGSDVSAILGLSRFGSARDVWLDKTGRSGQRETTWLMERGSALEGPLLRWFTKTSGIGHRTVGLQRNNTHPWMLGSLDGLADDDAGIEVKTASWWVRDDWADGQVADHAELQSQWYMAVTGLQRMWVIAAIADDDPVIREVHRDSVLIATLIDACSRFWHQNVLADKEPGATWIDLPNLRKLPVDPGKAMAGGPNEDSLAVRVYGARSRLRAAKKEAKTVEAELIQSMGDAEILVVHGEIAATRTTSERAGYTVQPSTVTTLLVPAKRRPWKE